MIPRIQTGTSFKGAGLYYLHDKKLDGERERLTTGRVAWTHAVNTLEDDPEAVLSEMRKTAFDQPLLKQISGNRVDGRPTERTVITVALSWAPGEAPTKEEMIEAGNSFLKHMRWHEHQALFVSHDDTKHTHLHLIINRVHPETGMTIDDTWSKRRSQLWALEYERERGHIYCEAREARYDRGRSAGAAHMNYREWQKWQEVNKDHVLDPEYRRALDAGEWAVLKETQRRERIAFWGETGRLRKELRRELREDVREEFGGEWRDYAVFKESAMNEAHASDREARKAIRVAHRLGGLPGMQAAAQIKERHDQYREDLREDLKHMRGDISTRQGQRLEELAAPALAQLSKDRSEAYKDVLARHRQETDTLRGDQAAGTRRHDLLAGYGRDASPARAVADESQKHEASGKVRDRRAATDRTRSTEGGEDRRGSRGPARDPLDAPSEARNSQPHPQREKAPRKDGADLVAGAGLALIGKIAESIETLFDGSTAEPSTEEEARTMDQDAKPEPHPSNVQRQEQNDAEREARRKQDLDFYLQQRDRERHHDRGR